MLNFPKIPKIALRKFSELSHTLRRSKHVKSTQDGVVQMVQVPSFGIFLKSASRLVPDGWVGLKSSGYRCHFRAFQLKLFILDTQNIGNGPVVEELQPLAVGRISIKSNGFNEKWIQNHDFVFITI